MGLWTYLSGLYISFSNKIEAAYAQDLSRGIQCLSSLSTLHLMLDLSEDGNTKDTLKLISDLPPLLKTLRLKFKLSKKVINECLLRKFFYLSTLKLTLGDCDMGNDLFLQLSQTCVQISRV